MRIAIVNDQAAAVEVLRLLVRQSGEHTVAWVAADGREAVRRCHEDHPELILMDLIMPVLDGVEATRRIMAECPCPILVMTASVSTRSTRVYEALAAGALDVLKIPRLRPDGVAREAVLAKIGAISRLLSPGRGAAPGPRTGGALVVIGSSSGGPGALARVLAALPTDFPAPLLICQHIDPDFAAGLAEWLTGQTSLSVRVAVSGDVPEAGRVYLARGPDHMVITRRGALAYTEHPQELVHRPSVDVLFRSVSEHWRGAVVGVLLTGMGEDGAAGLKILKEKGHYTVAQDKGTSAIFGMPKAAIDRGAATAVVPLEEIGGTLVRRVS